MTNAARKKSVSSAVPFVEREIDLQMAKIIQRIKKKRKQRHFSRDVLAYEAGIDLRHLVNLEHGLCGPIRLDTLIKIAHALNSSVQIRF